MWGSVSSEGAYKQGSEMSDDDRDIDIESDDGDDVFGNSRHGSVAGASSYYSQEEKRAHHNALERKRRDHIKDSFTSLRDSVPALQGEKVASRAQILKKAADYILFMRRKENSNQQDIDDLKRQNAKLEQQISMLYKYLEKNKSFGDALVYGDDDNLDLDYLGTDPDSYDGDTKPLVKNEI